MRSFHRRRPRVDECDLVCESLSASLDDEVPPLALEAAQRHLAGCEDCARFGAAVGGLGATLGALPAHRASGPAPNPVTRRVARPGMTAAVTAAVAREQAAHAQRRRLELRVLVAAAGAIQLLLASTVLLGTGGHGHLGRDLAALQLALGAGFLIAAFQPHRAAGVLPVGLVVAAGAVVVAAVDVAAGRTAVVAELAHLGELAGVVALWALCRRLPVGRDLGAPAVGGA